MVSDSDYNVDTGYVIVGEKMQRIGPTELIIILIIIVLLFGVGRISKIAGELGKSIRAFRKGLDQDDTEEIEGEEKKP